MSAAFGEPPTQENPAPRLPFCVEDILPILQNLANQTSGKTITIARDTRIDHYFKQAGKYEHIDLLDLGFRIEKALGVSISHQDWKFLIGPCDDQEEWEARYAVFFTFGRLAELLAQRMLLYKVEPINVLGRVSLTAGAFRAIERVARTIDPTAKPIAPSDPILQHFRGRRLEKLWARVRIMSANRIPPLPMSAIRRVANIAFDGLTGALLWLIIYGVGVWALVTAASFTGFGLGERIAIALPACGYGLYYFSRLFNYLDQNLRPNEALLPKSIESFRDLAELIAGDRGGWCEKCGYDLTGLTTGRCPECGTDLPRPTPNRRADATVRPRS